MTGSSEPTVTHPGQAASDEVDVQVEDEMPEADPARVGV